MPEFWWELVNRVSEANLALAYPGNRLSIQIYASVFVSRTIRHAAVQTSDVQALKRGVILLF
jgi:hypothetical protein